MKEFFSNLDKGKSYRVFIYIFSQVILEGFAVIAMPLFARLLTTEQYGVTSLYTTWSTIAAQVVGLKVDSIISTAKVHFEENDFKKFCANAYFVVVTIGIVVLIVVSIFLQKISLFLHLTPAIVLFLIFHACGTECTRIQSSIFLISRNSIKDVTLSISLSFSAYALSVIFIIFMKENEDVARILGMGIPYIILGGISCVIYMRRISKSLSKNMLEYIFKLSTPMVFSGLSALILNQSDRVMISDIIDVAQAGIYSFCYLVATPLSSIWLALGKAWRPDYYDKLKEGNKEWLKEHSDNYLFLFTCLTCGYLLVSEEALKILGTKDYWSGIPMLPLVILGCFFQFLYSFPMNYEMYCRKTKKIGTATSITALINIALNLWLIPVYGILGAAIATLAAYLILFLIHDRVARRIGGYHYNWIFYLKGLLPVMVCFLITYAFADYLVLRWLIGTGIAIILIRRILKKRTLL